MKSHFQNIILKKVHPKSLNGTHKISMWLSIGELLVSKLLIRLISNNGHTLGGGVG